jgi:hypothetical protein
MTCSADTNRDGFININYEQFMAVRYTIHFGFEGLHIDRSMTLDGSGCTVKRVKRGNSLYSIRELTIV